MRRDNDVMSVADQLDNKSTINGAKSTNTLFGPSTKPSVHKLNEDTSKKSQSIKKLVFLTT